MAEFDPRQLDQLEDALELLEHCDDLASLELSPELSARLGEYQEVLGLCRDAFPLESPRDELLDGVIAEAREVSRRPRLRDGFERDRSSWRRFWERWRGTLVPGVALAASAAAVLWMIEPEAERGSDLLATSTEEARERAPESEKRSQPASEPSSDEDEDAQPEPPAETEAEAAADPTPAAEVGEPEPEAKPRKKSKAAGDAIPLAPEPAPEPMTKDETWKSLERADVARRVGDCDRARSIYEQIIPTSSDSTAIARAKAGIGLCHEQSRRDTEAANWYQQARSSSPDIDSWINRERDEQPRPGEAKKHRNKTSLPAEADAL